MRMSDRGLAELVGHEGIASRRYKADAPARREGA